VPQDEPFKKLINQGMIQGRSNFVYRLHKRLEYPINSTPVGELDMISNPASSANVYVSKSLNEGLERRDPEVISYVQQKANAFSKELGLIDGKQTIFSTYGTTPINVNIELVDNDITSANYGKLNTDAFRKERPDLTENALLIPELDDRFMVGMEVEKMSKSKFNVVNPDDIVEKYGADVLRMYEMFLGPLEQAKPWNTNGIDGVYRFMRKLWRLFYKDNATGESEWIVTDETATPAELKVLHRTIQKAENDIETYSFNTSISAFMVCVNELTALNCHKQSILQELVLLLSPYAPHIAEELWAKLGNEPGTVSYAPFPVFNPNHLIEDSFEYPIQINGKVRTTLNFTVDRAPKEIEAEVLANEIVLKWLEGKTPKKVVVVPKRIVNVVI
jgi:leucyl-tRNA synthetase